MNNGPILGKLHALDELGEDYKGVEHCSTDDTESHKEAIYLQEAIKDKTNELMTFLYWN